ncbi:MAG: dihydropteroate synthase [Chthoniobacteraceae bacterium]
MLWRTLHRTFDLATHGLIMGVVNVTTDSFSDGGRFADAETAVAHARHLAAEGAEIIDIGGESTRPGSAPVNEAEELRRVRPVIERLAGDARFVISIDTRKPAVARAAMECGAAIINDVTGLRDPAMREVVRNTGAGAIGMHMQGDPQTMQRAPHYGDVTTEIRDFFRQIFDASVACGIDPMCLAFDPGIGFGKTAEHNLALIRNLESMRVSGRPLVLGISRKSIIGKVLGSSALEDREWPTVALTSYGRARGASVFRVHEARPNLHALRMTEAILAPEAVA